MAGRVAVGLDIGTSGVRAAELSFGRGGVTLERFGQVALPAGAVRDGEVVDQEAVAAALRQLWGSAKFSSKKVALGVANQRVIVRQVDLPSIPVQELKRSLPFMVQDYVPIPIEQAILDFHPIEELVGEGGQPTLRVLLVAAAREMVLGATEAVAKAGLQVAMVDLTAFAMLRALTAHDELGLASGEAEALVDVGSRVTNIIVHQNGVPRFVRILLMGGENVSESVAERMGIPLEQAEAIKQQLGISPTAGIPVSEHPAARTLESVATHLIDEIRGSLDYYLAQQSALPIRRLILSGGGMRLGQFDSRMAAATRLPVEVAAPFSRLHVGKTGLSAEQLGYVERVATVPVGLAMGVAS